jgi:hypothetical protein
MIMQILRMREQARRRLTFSQAVSVKCLFLTQSGHGGSYAITTLLSLTTVAGHGEAD